MGVAFDADGRPYATIDFARYTDPVQEGEQWSARILELLNADRHAKGMEPLVRLGAMDAVALRWAEQQAGEERMYHNPRHREQIPPGHVLAGENVAWGQPTPERMYTRWYNSPGHYANLFNPEFTHVGIGVAFTPDGYAYGTQNFARYVPAGPAARKPQPPRTDIPGDDGSSTRAIDDGGIGGEGNRYFLNDTFSAYANIVFDYANPAGRSYVGDWDGNGTDTFAVRRGKTYFIANAIRGGDADTTLNYGRAGDTTLVGDWDGDGKDTLGVRR